MKPPRGKGDHWSRGDVRTAKKLLAAGAAPEHVAERLGRSTRAVRRQFTVPVRSRPPRHVVAAERSCRAWTDAEERTLRLKWEDGQTAGVIAKALGRSKGAVLARVQDLRLGGATRGLFSLRSLARLVGYEVRALVRLLDAAKVKYVVSGWTRGTARPRKFYDRDEVEAVVTAFLATETISGAARARDLGSKWLWTALVAAGLVTKERRQGHPRRYASEVIDRVIAEAKSAKAKRDGGA